MAGFNALLLFLFCLLIAGVVVGAPVILEATMKSPQRCNVDTQVCQENAYPH